MHQHTRAAALAAITLACAGAAQAAVAVSSAAFSYAQGFDSLALSGSAQTWVNDSTLAGWSLFDQAGAAIGSYAADTGASNAGSFKSFGSSGATDRALGGVGSGGSYFGSPASGSVAGWIALALTNATGAALSGFTLAYDGEQWRNGGNTSVQTMAFEYGFGSSFAAVSQWAAPGAGFDFSAPLASASAGALDGNAAAYRVAGLGGTVTTPWAAGDTLWLRWTELNDVGNDHGLAIDQLSLSVSAVPEPGSYALLLAGLAAIGGFVRMRRH